MTENILTDKNVLVVDDNVINQLVVKHSLIKLGANTDIVGDGVEAISIFKEKNYDLVLMDIQMPQMDGYDTTRHLRNQMKSTVPIIAMTAYALKGEEEKCIECGMNGYVSKPFTLESLYNAINAVFDSKLSINVNPNIISNSETSIDLSIIYEISGDDDAYIKMMISTFLENLPMVIKKIEDAMAMEDWQNVFISAHYSKSSLSVVKVKEIYEWMMEIEQSAKNKTNLDKLPALIEKVKAKFVVVEALLMEKFSFNNSSSMV